MENGKSLRDSALCECIYNMPNTENPWLQSSQIQMETYSELPEIQPIDIKSLWLTACNFFVPLRINNELVDASLELVGQSYRIAYMYLMS